MKSLFKLIIVNIALFSLTFNYVGASDDAAPTIESNGTVYFIDVDVRTTTEEIEETLSAYDDLDGDITDNIYIIFNDYVGHEDELGAYTITFAVRDSSLQLGRLSVEVRVVDIASPEVSGNEENIIIDINHEPLDFSEGVTITDNIDEAVSISIDASEVNYSSYGFYKVYYTATDSSDNSYYFERTVTIKDLIPPVVTGPEVIYKDVLDLLTIDDIFYDMTASDNIDFNIKNQLVVHEDSYTGNGDTVGTYNVVFRSVDSSGNVIDYEVTINVVENMPNIIYKDGYILELGRDETLSQNDIELLLTVLGELDRFTSYSLEVIKDQYTNNKTVSGEYDYFVKFISNTGETLQKNFVIRVYHSTELPVFPGDETPSWISNNWETVIVGSLAFTIVAVGLYILVFKRGGS